MLSLIRIGLSLGLASTLVGAATDQAAAETWRVGTHVGTYKPTSFTTAAGGAYRASYLSFYGLPWGLGLRGVHRVYDGMGLTGAFNNWRAALHLTTSFCVLDLLTLEPHLGGSMAGALSVPDAVGVDAGLTGEVTLLFGMSLMVGVESTVYQNASVTDYRVGPRLRMFDLLTITPALTGVVANGYTTTGQGIDVQIHF